jgi:hypothetical protein
MGRRLSAALLASAAAVGGGQAFATPTASTAGSARVLTGIVADPVVLTLKDGAGARVKSVVGGALYTITVRDLSQSHNFRIVGPGVNSATDVDKKHTVVWKLRFRKGAQYAFICDPHELDMRGSFRAR